MADENLTNVSQQENTGAQVDNNQYIEAIKEMRANSVDKTEFEKLQKENKMLLQSLVNGDTIDQPQTEAKPSIDDLRKKMFSGELNNLEYVQTALDLRTALIEKGERDPFLPNGHDYQVTQFDVDAANKVAEVYQQCIDDANGDSNVFTAKLMSRTAESSNINKKGR